MALMAKTSPTMLLRVDVHPGSLEKESCMERCITHHISVNTGPRWTLGRKNANIEVKDDKTVSREHLALSFVTTNATYKEIPSVKTTTEKEACGDDQEIGVMLENSGKLGTFLVVRDTTASTSKDGTKDDDGGDSDATEDEMESQYPSQAPRSVLDVVLSPVAKHYISQHARLEPIPFQGKIPLRIPHDGTAPVIVQCGKFGTTVVITRLPLRLVCSGDAKQVISDLPLYQIGASTMETIVKDTTDYLVTPVFGATVKQLTCWCLGIPFVTDAYVQAWLNRTASDSPIPHVLDYRPTSDGQTIWSTKHNPGLFRACTLLLTEPPAPNELERFCQAAGITNVVPLYDAKGIVSEATIKERIGTHCFYVDSRRKIAKLLKKLKVPSITGKMLAKAITEQRALADTKGVEIAPAMLDKEEEEKPDDSAMDATITVEIEQKAKSDTETNANAQVLKEKDPPTKATLVGGTEESTPKEETFYTAQSAEEPKEEVQAVDAPMMDLDNDAFPEPDNDDTVPPPESTVKPVKRLRVIEDETITSVSRGGERQTIAIRQTGGGWLQALPQGRERQKFQRSMEEMKEMTGVEHVRTAATEIVSGLVRQPTPAPAIIENDDGPNYKAFRKNPVPPPLLNTVHMVSVAPGSERTLTKGRESDDEAIEEQQRIADELFRDPQSTTTARKSRRR